MKEQSLIALYKQRLNLQDATFTRIDHIDAMVAIVYKVTELIGSPFILKISTRTQDYLRELYFLKHFAGTLPVPRIIQEIPPETGVHGAILMEFLPGTLLNKTELNYTLAYEIGSQLAVIHLNRIAGYGDLIQPNDLNADPRVYFTCKFEESFAECSNHLPKTLLDQCHRYYDAHINLLSSVDGPCIIHRDFRPGNVIVNNGKLQGIIDWASGRASFAEEDFCPLELGEWGTNPNLIKIFLRGYESVRPIPDYNAIMSLLSLNRSLATIGFTVKQGTWASRHARLYQYNRQFLDTFF
ncbi:TPA: phosphotransferase [Legionella pneumophila]|nr:phosphotransferase [Legionella pneumophila]HAT9133952.1 phosphotransferase [Legionella pneumophila subsp. pneumophila]HAU0937186.1 phosphotransferase [Legionella pneumophila]HAU1689053.1 phosphotransferase [Legionella pneumophila]HCJ1124945.1 phosphotransferase [Legionella pneumophila]